MEWTTIIVDLGQNLVPWLATVLLGLLSKYVYVKIKNDYWRSVVSRATIEVVDAVQAVHQTYVDAIKEGRSDGKLTEKEKTEARIRALKTAKANLGPGGFAKLAKIFGGASAAENWLATKTESVVGTIRNP